jgi:hypothetical protein
MAFLSALDSSDSLADPKMLFRWKQRLFLRLNSFILFDRFFRYPKELLRTLAALLARISLTNYSFK